MKDAEEKFIDFLHTLYGSIIIGAVRCTIRGQIVEIFGSYDQFYCHSFEYFQSTSKGGIKIGKQGLVSWLLTAIPPQV